LGNTYPRIAHGFLDRNEGGFQDAFFSLVGMPERVPDLDFNNSQSSSVKFAFLKNVISFAFVILLFLGTLWAAGALWYDLPFVEELRKVSAAALLGLVSVSFFFFGKSRLRFIVFALPLVVAAWWFTLRPSNDRTWLPDVAETPWAEIEGDLVTLHNVRNFDYQSVDEYTPKWETRKVKLSEITGVDIALTYWGSPWMAHPIVSFQFENSPPVCFSIETRKEEGEAYSAIGGFFRQYELIYLVADERDVVRVRTNYREGEDVYLYRLKISPENARVRFLEYLETLNHLKDHPRWYNALTTNCTTSIRSQHHDAGRTEWDWRILLNGKSDEMLFENGALHTADLPFAKLKERSKIDVAAQAAGSSQDFSRLIRASLPTFQQPTLQPK
jgi:hypothetical protein